MEIAPFKDKDHSSLDFDQALWGDAHFHTWLRFDRQAIEREIEAGIPPTIDEKNNSISWILRWHLKPKPNSFSGLSQDRDGMLVGSITYYGDIETKTGIIPGGCHLGNGPGKYDPKEKYVLINVKIAFYPTLVREGENAFISLANPQISSKVEPGSDVSCGFGVFTGLDIEGLTNLIINSAAIKDGLVQRLARKRIPFPLNKSLERIDKPIPVAIGDGKYLMCIFPWLYGIETGNAKSTAEQIEVESNLRVKLFATVREQSCGDERPVVDVITVFNNIDAANDDLLVRAPLFIPWSTINSVFEKNIVGRSVQVADKHVTITGARIEVLSGTPMLSVSVEGQVRGRIEVRLRPKFDGHTLTVPCEDLTRDSILSLWQLSPRLAYEVSENLKRLCKSGYSEVLFGEGQRASLPQDLVRSLNGVHESKDKSISLDLALESAELLPAAHSLVADEHGLLIYLSAHGRATAKIDIGKLQELENK